MGFRPEPTIYNLNFDDTPLKGLKVRASCCTMGEFNEMLRFADQSTTGTVAEKNEGTVALFLSHLVEWNLEDPKTGQPTPFTMEGVKNHESSLVNQIVTAWQVAMVTVSAPLSLPSLNGATSQEDTLGLAAGSTSPESWPKPS